MDRIFRDEQTLKNCKIYRMLREQAARKHLSFHMPGHKNNDWDITELSYSDNLANPSGVISEAEQEIAKILGAARSFILTDGSTSGVLSMLYAAKTLGIKKIAACESSHKSLFNGCAVLDLTLLLYPPKKKDGIPNKHTMCELNANYPEIFNQADALFFTSPDYYGNVGDLAEIRAYCDRTGKTLLIDGAHGSHLHFDKTLHVGAYADIWIDGAHKTLPTLTQGALVSARTEEFVLALKKGVDIFRTTSPSYPIMASVEYGVKYPRNESLEQAVNQYKKDNPRIYQGVDWTKFYAIFGKHSFEAHRELEQQGIYGEFCDGNGILFYLSPATDVATFDALTNVLDDLFQRYPYLPNEAENDVQCNPAPLVCMEGCKKEWVNLAQSEGRICAVACGFFPPCLPLIFIGERVTKEKIALLQKATHVFGLDEGKICVVAEDELED